jgi:hypothetical protein
VILFVFRFKANVKCDLGAFGKVLVEKIRTTGRNDPVFEFNLYKASVFTLYADVILEYVPICFKLYNGQCYYYYYFFFVGIS